MKVKEVWTLRDGMWFVSYEFKNDPEDWDLLPDLPKEQDER